MEKPYNLIEALLKGTLLYLANRRPVHRLIMQHDLLRGLIVDSGEGIDECRLLLVVPSGHRRA